MATIKSYTDIEQSRKLAEILPLESADYFYAPDAGIVVTEPYKLNKEDETVITAYKGAIPCWSLAALLSIIRGTIGYTIYGIKNVYISCEHNDSRKIETNVYDNEVDACVAMIEKLHKIKKL